jgi:hypothetical protein
MTGTPLRVVELSSGIAGAYAGWLLREMGAEVVRLGPLPIAADAADAFALALAYYATGKQGVDADKLAAAIAAADIVVRAGPPAPHHPARCSGMPGWRAPHRRLSDGATRWPCG